MYATSNMNSYIIKGPKFKLPVDEGTLGQFFFNNAQKYSYRLCHIDATSDESETYGSVNLRSTRVALAMQKRGITSSDNVTFCTANTLDNTIPLIASAYLGAKISNLEPSLSIRHTSHLLSLVSPKMIFVEEAAVTMIEDSLVGCNFHPEIVVFGSSTKYSVFADFDQPQDDEDEFQPVQVDVNEVAYMIFSSGTTGLPKGICHSHRSILHIASQVYQNGLNEKLFHFTSFYWITAIMMMTACFKAGSHRIFSRNPSPEKIFQIIEKHKVVSIFSAPILTYKFTNFENPAKYDTSSLKMISCSGTPMAVSQLKKMNKLFPTAVTSVCYGMSEAGVVAGFHKQDDREFILQKLPSTGRPAPGIHLKIVDLDTEELLGPNQKGEIRLKGPSLMVGYYRLDSTQAFDESGFLKTGDIGYYDGDQCVYLIERIKEMFKYQSWHIIPSSIEAVLLEHPNIKEAVVFGLPDGENGEVPAACVVVNEDSDIAEKEIDEFLKKRVADRERLRGGVTFVQSIPKTPTGKVVRKEVKDFVIRSKIE